MKKLMLFVWEGHCPDYSDGIAFAIAANEKDARALVEKKHGYSGDHIEWGTLTTYPLNVPIAFAISGGG